MLVNGEAVYQNLISQLLIHAGITCSFVMPIFLAGDLQNEVSRCVSR